MLAHVVLKLERWRTQAVLVHEDDRTRVVAETIVGAYAALKELC